MALTLFYDLILFIHSLYSRLGFSFSCVSFSLYKDNKGKSKLDKFFISFEI